MSKTNHSFVQCNLQSDKKNYKAELVVLTSSFFFARGSVKSTIWKVQFDTSSITMRIGESAIDICN